MSEAPAITGEAAAQRRKAFVDAAREAFFREGYASTTMSAIASAVGGSKTTLWTYFPSKEQLFSAVVDDILESYCGVSALGLSVDDPTPDTLRRLGRILLDSLLLGPVLSLHRLVVAEATRFPDLAALYHERAAGGGEQHVAAYFAELMVRGELRQGEPMVAVRQFSGMCQAGVYQHAILSLPVSLDNQARQQDVDAAVDTFLRAWGRGA